MDKPSSIAQWSKGLSVTRCWKESRTFPPQKKVAQNAATTVFTEKVTFYKVVQNFAQHLCIFVWQFAAKKPTYKSGPNLVTLIMRTRKGHANVAVRCSKSSPGNRWNFKFRSYRKWEFHALIFPWWIQCKCWQSNVWIEFKVFQSEFLLLDTLWIRHTVMLVYSLTLGESVWPSLLNPKGATKAGSCCKGAGYAKSQWCW